MTGLVVALVGKGGGGKTTAAGTLGALAAADGARVALVDLDSSATLTGWLAPGLADDALTTDDVLTGAAALEAIVAPVRPGVDLLPGSLGLVRVEDRVELDAVTGLVDGLRGTYDLALLDCRGGTASRLAAAAAGAADSAVLPFEPEPMSMTPITDARHVLERVGTPLAGLLPNRVRGRGTVVGRIVLDVYAQGGWPVLPPVRRDVRAVEAVARHQLLDDYAPTSAALEDYRKCHDRLAPTWGT